MFTAMNPHANQPVLQAGTPLESAATAMIMVHGRGAGPSDILSLAREIDRPSVAYLAPAAAGGSWYPLGFMSPREQNEPWLSSALGVIGALVSDLLARGIPSTKILLLGFSQGACLSSEFTIRHPRKYGGLLVLSGGLIGPPGTTWNEVTTSLDGTPVFLGCSDVDGHIPKERVMESETVFVRLGARVKRTLYRGMGHAVNEDEIAEIQKIVDQVLE